MSRIPRMSHTLAGAALAGAATLAAAPAAHAQGIPTPTSNWPCEVLLCMANPRGPMAVSQCVPPIRRLFRELARGRMFPVCTMASGPNGSSWAGIAASPWEPCPAGTTHLAAGANAALAAAMPAGTRPPVPSGGATSYTGAASGFIYRGIGDGSDALRAASGEGMAPLTTPVVCVAGERGMRYDHSFGPDGMVTVPVALYDTIYVAPPQLGGMAVDVFVDNRFWQRVPVDLTGY